MKECKDIYEAALKYKEEYDEFSVVDEQMRLITLTVICISKKLYTDPEDQKYLDDAFKILVECKPA